MHLKLYWKLQKKERLLEISRDTLRKPMSHGKANGDVKARASYMKPTVLPSASLVKASSRKPFGILSPNVLCSMSGKSPVENSLNVKAKRNVLSAAVHQSEEGLPGTWAIVKPGNTKEKIAFFAAHQYINRIGSMKIKSSWHIDGRATKRRKKSGDLKKAKLQLEMMRDINSQCYQSHCSVHYMSDSGEGVCASRPLSVIQMVAFLEQKATALLASCTKNCTNSPAIVKISGQSRGIPPAPEPFSAPETCEEPKEQENPETGRSQGEPVHQGQREPGSLSRNNSFHRNVGRVLLTNGSQASNKSEEGSADTADPQENPLQPISVGEEPSVTEHHSVREQAWDGTSQSCPSLPATVSFHMDSTDLEPGHPEQRQDPLCISITVCTVEKDRPEALDSLEEPLPGMLFFLSSGQDQQVHPQLREHPVPEASEASQSQDAAEGSSACEEKDASVEPLLPAASQGGSTSQVLEAAMCKKQVSQVFLETRFKIQQLLEPQQYMACLPHHIIVKIFRLLPTLSLAILKCTCRYFKSIIEYYNIRPADSRWVRDPRYREDPCKQCKKKYVKGDVSLSQWHPKPYCQALPYGPGYWMCCHQSQKGFPGCKLGLHDNHWLPACHSFNRAIHKKSRGNETEEEY
uniref:F-box domain-containing protein n=1 Tax=Mus spicilegus TaxID=10103 RepID=A0A8C6H2C7_MUSSI